jgi:hypothetical protein
MADGWLTPANIVATCGAIASVTACIISWRVFRWQRSNDEPAVTVDAHLDRSSKFYTLRVMVQNPSLTGWNGVSVQLIKPSGILGIDNSYTKDRGFTSAGSVPFDLEEERVSRTFPLRLIVLPQAFGSAFILITSPDPGSEIKLSMRLSLASNEAVQRKRTIAIKRTLPALTSTA